MAQLEKWVTFSGKNWGGAARITYTAQNGTVSLTKLEFKAYSSTSAGYGAYYDIDQTRTFTCGGSGQNAVVKHVRINNISYQDALLSKTLTWTGLTGNSVTLNFTVQARSSSPNTLTFSFDIPMSYTTYTVSYNANGGSSTPSAQTKTYGTNLTLASAISRNSTTANGYTVSFNANGGSVSPTSKTAVNTTSYSFSSWQATNGTTYSGGGTYSANEETTMTAQWSSSTSNGAIATPSASRSNTSVSRTVTFNGNGGTAGSSSLTSSATVTYSGNGWYTNTSGGTKRCANGGSYTPSGGETLYQQWGSSTGSYSSINFPNATKSNGSSSRTVTFNATTNGGTCSTASKTSTATITYSLTGWWTQASAGTKRGTYGGSYTPSASETLYAQWSSSTGTYSAVSLPNATKSNGTATRTVTFNANGGTCSTTSLNSTATITYSLTGWWTAASSGTKRGTSGGSYTPSASETLYAQFSSSTGSYSSVTLPIATRSGYTFKGWNTNSSATTGTIGNYTPTGTYTMYAIWEEDQPSSVQLSIGQVTRTKIRFSCSCERVVNPIFILHYTPQGGSEHTYTVAGSGTSRTDILTGLTPGIKYNLYMEAKNSAQTLSSTSSGVEKTTLVNTPKNLSVNATNVKYNSTDISCSATGDTNGNITNYTLYWRKKPAKPIYDMAIKKLSDNSCWARIFYHNNIEGTELFSTVEECKNTQTENKYSRLYLLDDNTYKRNDGKFEFMLCYPNFSEEYNRWKQSDSPCNIYTGTGQGTKVPGYEGIHIGWSGNGWGGLERTNLDPYTIESGSYIDGSIGFGNWWYAIGAIANYNQVGIPGPDSNTISSDVELWVRIDDTDSWGSQNLGTNTSAEIENLDNWTKYIFFISSKNKGGTNWSSALNIETYKGSSPNIMIKNGWNYEEYQKLDYIQSQAAQWVDTGINPNDYNGHLNIEADVQFTSTTGAWQNGWQTIIGAAYGDSEGTWTWNPQFHLAINTNNHFIVEYPCSESPTTTDYGVIESDIVASTTRHRVSLIIQRNVQSLKIDGFIKEQSLNAYGGPDCNLYIFGRNYKYPSTTYPIAGSAANLKLYHLTIIDTATQSILRDFFPCKRIRDNKVGLYDVITDTFFINANNQADLLAGNNEVWNKGHLLYKKDGAWKRVEKLYKKNDNHWKEGK